jgi:hypothetical protein
MREFRPPVRPSVFRVVLGLVIPFIIAVPVALLVVLAVPTEGPRYTITGGVLTVSSGERWSSPRSVRVADLTTVRAVDLGGGKRRAGTSLPGLCAGHFAYPDLGDVWQVTDCSRRAILLEATGAALPILVTPPDPSDFLARLKTGADTTIALPPADRTILRILALVLGPIALLSSAILPVLLLLGPRRMVYLVGGGMLEARTVFGKKRWPTEGARARAYTPSRPLRLMGTSAPGYHTGLFRESGQTTRIYATRLDQGVLFEGPARVLLSPDDPEAMLRALREEGVTIESRRS